MLSEWLSRAMAGKFSQAELARQLSERLGRSIDRAAVNKMVKGTRELSADELLAISDITGAPIPQKPPQPLVRVVGYVGAGSEAHYYADGQGSTDFIAAPEGFGEHTAAVEIRGDSLGPLFDRWLVFYDDVRSPVTPDLIGELCVVGLPDGRILIKKLKKSRARGLYHLLSQTEDPILDVTVEWAAKVKHLVPR
jgi:hypothetical protein